MPSVWPTFALKGAAALGIAALGLGLVRVRDLEARELERTTSPSTLRERMQAKEATSISARLDAVELEAGEHALFELCARDGLSEDPWLGAVDFAILHLSASKLMLRVPLDAARLAHVRRGPTGGCLKLGSGVLEEAGTYSVEAVWPDRPPPSPVLDVPLTLRVLAKPELSALDRACVAVLGLSLLVVIVALSRKRTRPGHGEDRARGTAAALSAAAAALALLWAVRSCRSSVRAEPS